MKKFLLTILLMAPFVLNAQEANSHLFFKGTPINGSVAKFVSKMTEKGMTVQKQADAIAMLNGDFDTYKNCDVIVSSSNHSGQTAFVAVVFPAKKNWEQLYLDYSTLKSKLTSQYGEPQTSVQKFHIGKNALTEEEKLEAVKNGRCEFKSVYEPVEGVVTLSVEYRDEIGCYVMIAYMDRINSGLE